MKKAFSIFLALVMVLSVVCVGSSPKVYAAEGAVDGTAATAGSAAMCEEPSKASGTYPIWFNLYPDDWTGGDPPTIQVTDENKDDILGDGGSIKYSPGFQNYGTLTFNDPDFGSNSAYDLSGKYAALIIGDTEVDLFGTAYIPTIYSDSPDSFIVMCQGDIRVGYMSNALYSAGGFQVVGGTFHAGSNGIPLEVGEFRTGQGKVVAESSMGTAIYVHGRIVLDGGSVTAAGGPDHPAIFSESYISIGPYNGYVKASVFTSPDEDPGIYDEYEGLECRIIALEEFNGNYIDILEPEDGKMSEIEYKIYDENGDPQTVTAYGVTKADGSPSASVLLQSSRLVTITKCKLELAGKIGLRLYFRAPESARFARICFEEIDSPHSYGDPVVTLDLSRDGNPNYSAEQDLFIITFPKITSREMTRHILLEVRDEHDAEMPEYYVEEDVCYNPWGWQGFEFCAADWASKILNNEDSTEEAKFMAKALLNYGGHAQVYLSNFNPDYPANPNNYLAEEMAALEADPDNNMVVPDEAYDIGFDRATLALEADTTIRLYFNKPVKVYVDGAEKTVYRNGSTYLAMIDGISSRNISKKYKITVASEDGSESADIYYSVLSWANKQITDGNERSMPTAKALYLYNRAALEYLGPVKP